MPRTCFLKEIASNPFVANGRPVPFEILPNNQGLIALESPKDDPLIAVLTEAASKHVGGIVRITEEQMAEKKSLASSMQSRSPKQKEMLRPMPKGPFERKAERAPAVNPAPREAVPLTNSALQKLAERGAAQVPVQPAIPIRPSPSSAPTPAPTETTPPGPVEGFRPVTRRISRRKAAAEQPVAPAI